jgi:acetate kinase
MHGHRHLKAETMPRVAVIVTVNSGSTSIKLAAFAAEGLEVLHAVQHSGSDLDGAEVIAAFLNALPEGRVEVVVHRVVHGGTRFSKPVLIDDGVLAEIDGLSELAPLHNPPALRWITAARNALGPRVKHIAVFDTAFFACLPPVATHYAVPESMGTVIGVRRYGFHGIAHEEMLRRWTELNPQLAGGGRLISMQLGGGCSIAAISGGQPLDTSMGFSPLEGLMMATRAGDLDPAIVPFLEKRLDLTAEQVIDQLNRESGLKGVSQRSSSFSELLDHPSPAAQLAVDLYCYRARKYIGAYLTVLGSCDGIVFGGGVGEHVPAARERILSGMEWAGVELDLKANATAQAGEAQINSASSRVQVWVLPADEAFALARAAQPFTTLE